MFTGQLCTAWMAALVLSVLATQSAQAQLTIFSAGNDTITVETVEALPGTTADFGIGPVFSNGGNKGVEESRTVTFRFRLDTGGAANRTYTFTFDTVPVTDTGVAISDFPIRPGSELATPGTDYTDVNSTVTLAVGANGNAVTRDVTITTLGDETVEFNEDILINLENLRRTVPTPATTLFSTQFAWLTATIYSEDRPAGSVDNTYNDNSTVLPFPGANNTVNALVLDTSGNAVMGGDFTSVNGIPRNGIVRQFPSGAVDTSFNPGSGANSFISTIALQGNGQMIIGGGFTSFDGVGRQRIARLNANGSLDSSFNPGTGANSNVREVELQTDGKIIVVGEFTVFNGSSRNRIVRLNADGSVDPTFNPGTGADDVIRAVEVQANGSIVVAGDFTTFNGESRNRIVRLNTDGSVDFSFDPGSGFNNTVFTLDMDSSQRILAGGAFTTYDGVLRGRVCRVLATGAIDTSFNPGSLATGGANDTVYFIEQVADGQSRIIIGGLFTSFNQSYRRNLARLYSDGTLDTDFMDRAYCSSIGFWQESPQNDSFITAARLEASGSYIAAGFFDQVGGWDIDDFALSDTGQNETDEIPVWNNGNTELRKNFCRIVGGDTPGPGQMGFLQSSYSVDEFAGQVRFLMFREANTTLAGILSDLKVTPTTATAGGTDFNMVNPVGGATFTPMAWLYADAVADSGGVLADGSSTANSLPLDFSINNDTVAEGNEEFTMSLSTPRVIAENGVLSTGIQLPRDGGRTGTVRLNVSEASIAADGTVTLAEHRLQNGTPIIFDLLTGALPTEITDGQIYYVVNNGSVFNDTTFQFATRPSSLDASRVTTISAAVGTYEIMVVHPTDPALGFIDQTTVTIVDDDFEPGTFGFAENAVTVNEDAANATLTISRLGGVSGAVSMDAVTANVTATGGSDYATVNQALFFAAGETSKTLTISILDDILDEAGADETFTVTLQNITGPAGRAIAATGAGTTIDGTTIFGQLTVSITDNDPTGGISAGGVDTTFNSSVGTDNNVYSVAVDFQAHPLIGGEFTTYNNVSRNRVALLTAQGAIDTAFDPGSGANNAVFSVAIHSQTDVGDSGANRGKFVMGGDFTIYNSTNINRIVRLSPDGTIDSAFNPGSGANGDVLAIAIDATTGKIYIGGDFTQ
ncbi:MAG: Calx-beta domain-containing protein, partial [Limisphaerales bacterium]